LRPATANLGRSLVSFRIKLVEFTSCKGFPRCCRGERQFHLGRRTGIACWPSCGPRDHSLLGLAHVHPPKPILFYPVECGPEGGQAHLSSESSLYCRIFTEGLFGILPTGLDRFRCTPPAPPRPSTASATPSPPTNRSKSAFSSRWSCRRSFPNCSFPASTSRAALPCSRS